MDDRIKPAYVKDQEKAKAEAEKSMWTLSWRLKGLALGVFVILAYCYPYVGEYPAKIIIGGGILGYFLGWVFGGFFYTKK
ncbi:hypothetical protein K8R42_02725 [bacterium]|nr:hypothetical protein [bacterium]